ncbi:sigma-70 family RNA polymerase sigma factor [uncultured Marixanthomonas sp.]|uniref:RNA polymerase sigma factor n=1 Tax=uncultured Marixanthomonas sp. TaxID=757245 RepID=UPI0030DDBE11|tara:strand:+ start:302087 stop:302872 length:786 start_codon:yes stop_codon:yes gene_type:complete
MPHQEYERFKMGCPAALARIYATYRRRIFWVGWELLKDSFVIESLVQDTFLKLWMHRNKIESADHMYYFLRFVMKRECISYYTRPRNRFHRTVNSLDRYENYQDYMAGYDPLADAENLKRQERKQELFDRVKKILPLLDTEKRHLLELCLKHGFQYKAIAEAMGTGITETANQVKKTIEEIKKIVDNGCTLETSGKNNLSIKVQGEMTKKQIEVLRLRLEGKRSFAAIANELKLSQKEVHQSFMAAYQLLKERDAQQFQSA